MDEIITENERKDFGFISLQEAADYMKIHYMTLNRMLRAGNKAKLPFKRVGGRWMTTKEWLNEYFNSKLGERSEDISGSASSN